MNKKTIYQDLCCFLKNQKTHIGVNLYVLEKTKQYTSGNISRERLKEEIDGFYENLFTNYEKTCSQRKTTLHEKSLGYLEKIAKSQIQGLENLQRFSNSLIKD